MNWIIDFFISPFYWLFKQFKNAFKIQSQSVTAQQMDGTIVGEGTMECDIAGSPQMYGNDVDIWNRNTSPIKQKVKKK